MKIGIVGMGALGMLYGDLIVNNIGYDAIDFIVDKNRLIRYQQTEFTINQRNVGFNLVDATKAHPYDLVIVAVKSTALDGALETMKNCIGDKTIIISLINGISSEEIIKQKYGREKVIYAIAQGMDAVKFDGNLTYSKCGQILLGIVDKNQLNKLAVLTSILDDAKIDYEVKDNILHSIWAKFMLNVGINQICMAFDTNYGGALIPGKAYDTLIKAMKEVIELSHFEGIDLNDDDLSKYLNIIKTLDPQGLPSMAQDAKAKRYSEVEIFAGTVLTLAKKHHLDMPTNEFLYHRIKEIESSY